MCNENGCSGRGERSHTTATDLNVPASLHLEVEVTGVERSEAADNIIGGPEYAPPPGRRRAASVPLGLLPRDPRGRGAPASLSDLRAGPGAALAPPLIGGYRVEAVGVAH